MSTKYSGTASFEYSIGRYFDPDSKKLISSEDLSEDDGIEYEYQDITLDIDGESYYSPGKTSGSPDSCYPPSGETDITSAIGPDGKDWQDLLTKRERDDILQYIEDEVRDQY